MARRGSKARRRPKAHPQGVLELTARGYGFVKTAEGEFFIPSRMVGTAFSGDLVEIAPLTSKDKKHLPKRDANKKASQSIKPNARVTKVLLRAAHSIIGRYEIAEPFGVVIPEDPCIKHDIFTLRSDNPDIQEGDLVECEILDYPTRTTAATGHIVRVLGHEDDSRVGIDIIIAENGLETKFSSQVMEEANSCSLEVEKALQSGYRDLRNEFVFTIDPVDARDFDDSISLELEEDGYRLGIHIADVSQYVPYNSALDLTARKRGTSVYLVDRVIPMLPEIISNNLCSLVPLQDRLAVTVEVHLSVQGKVLSYEVFPSVICSKARLSYEQAQVLLDCPGDYREFRACDVPEGSVALSDETIDLLSRKIHDLHDVAKRLFQKRYKDGCMDFDRVEARVKLDESGIPVKVVFRRKTFATQMIEEAMILANNLVALWLSEKEMPCMYRIHEAPDGDSLSNLYEILCEFPVFRTLDKRLFIDGNPKMLQKALTIKGTTVQHELISNLLLRSMKRAVYVGHNEGHYGLALDTYCHFTSPIRRYPDLYVHRMIKHAYFGKTESFSAEADALDWISNHCSETERVSDKAQHDSQKLKLVEYMQGFIGVTFDAVIVSVSTFGLVVRLENTATGRVPIRDLGDEYFSYDPVRYTLTGSDSGKVYRLGQMVSVELVEAIPRLKRLSFTLV